MQTRAALAMIVLAAPAAAQSVLYDAGPAGTPPAAPPPTHQGWSASVTGSCAAGALSPDAGTGRNAWQIHDPGPGSVRYEKGLTWVGTGYDVQLVMLPLAGAVTLEIDSGDLITNSLFTLQLEVVGADLHVLHGGPTPVVCANAVDGGYHTFTFRGQDYTLDVWYDGVPVGVVDETAWGIVVSGRGLRWGTFGGTHGRARVQRVEMTLHSWGPLGAAYCSPAIPHSGGLPARIEAEGEPFAHRNGLRLFACDLPPLSYGFFLASETPDLVAQPGGSQGNLCLGGNIGRYVGAGQVQSSGGLGRMWLDVDLRAIPTTPHSVVAPGETWYFQAWFRDASPGPTSNFTDAVAVQY